MPATFNRVLKEDSYTGSMTRPYRSGTLTYILTRNDGADTDLDDLLDTGEETDLGTNLWPASIPPPERVGYATNITLTQVDRKTIREVVTYDNVTQWDLTWSGSNTQTRVPTAPGYVNCDQRDVDSSATWWRYGKPSDFDDSGYPWDDATVSADHQCNLEGLTSLACDLGGTPMTVPLPQEQLTVTLTFADDDTMATYRSLWRTKRGLRNNAAWNGYPQGTLLFAGASNRVSTDGSMPVADLRFQYCPYGWCRQRAVSDSNGQFTGQYLVSIDPPSEASTPCENYAGPPQRHAKYVYWIQLFGMIDGSGFNQLFTTEQATEVSGLLT